MSRHRMSDKEKAYFICLLFPIFWPFLPALIVCDIAEAIGRRLKSLSRRIPNDRKEPVP
jgi:hypothetical protein